MLKSVWTLLNKYGVRPNQSCGNTSFNLVFLLRALICASPGPSASTHAERCLELEAVGRWTHTFSRCPVSVAACSSAKMFPPKGPIQ